MKKIFYLASASISFRDNLFKSGCSWNVEGKKQPKTGCHCGEVHTHLFCTHDAIVQVMGETHYSPVDPTSDG